MIMIQIFYTEIEYEMASHKVTVWINFHNENDLQAGFN